MKRRMKDIDQELDVLYECMMELPKDSESYKKILEEYRVLLEMKNDAKRVRYGILTGVLVPVAGMCLAYAGDLNLKMVNQRIWNIATKLISTKLS